MPPDQIQRERMDVVGFVISFQVALEGTSLLIDLGITEVDISVGSTQLRRTQAVILRKRTERRVSLNLPNPEHPELSTSGMDFLFLRPRPTSSSRIVNQLYPWPSRR